MQAQIVERREIGIVGAPFRGGVGGRTGFDAQARNFAQTGEREHGTVTSEAQRIFENLKLLLESAGSSLDRIVQVHAMIYDRIEYDVLNRVYRQYVPDAPPARTVMSVQIEAGFKVMLDVIAAAETRQAAAVTYPRQVIEVRISDADRSRRPGLPLSPAIRAGDFVFLSGLTATD